MSLRKIRTLRQLPFEAVSLFAQAIFISTCVKLALLLLPFKIIKPYLGCPGKESDKDAINDSTYLRNVQTALRLCNKYTPWKTNCYVLALTGKILLNRKNTVSTLYFGFRKTDNNEYEGHAWLRSGSIIISGKQNIPSYHVQSYFT